MSVTGGIMAGAGLVGSLGSAAIEGDAAHHAADTQADAAKQAAQEQGELGQESLGYENYQYQQDRANEQPFLQSGANSLSTLDYLLGLQSPNATPGAVGATGSGSASSPSTLSIPGVSGSVSLPGVQPLTGTPNTNLGTFGELMQKYPGGQFTAPTAEQARETPGYQFALDQGTRSLDASAAANGSLLTGGTGTALQQFGQGLADTDYNNVYNRALQSYNTNYNTWSNSQANQFNRLAALANAGQTTAAQLGNAGLQSAGQVASTLNSTGQQVGQQLNNAAAATASGYIGQGSAWGQGLSGATGSLSQLALLQKLLQQQQGGGGGFGTMPALSNGSVAGDLGEGA